MYPSHPTAIDALRVGIELARRAILRPPPRMNLPDWADTYRRLSTASGAIGGRWQTHRVEVARGPMMALTEPGVQHIAAMTCTQLMKTAFLENVIGYFAHGDPCPMLLTQPKDGAAQAFSKERLVPMVQSSPELRKTFRGSKTRKSDDTILFKQFTGGFIALASAGSPTNLAMRAIRVVMQDEIDKYEATKEGDPTLLAEERAATFGTSAVFIRTCSPTIEETSRIYKSYVDGDQRRAFVRCPHCGEWLTLEFFKHVKWITEDGEHYTDTAAIWCDRCGTEWSEADRLKAVTTRFNFRHMQCKPFLCCGERQEPLTRYANNEPLESVWEWSDKYQAGYALCKHCGKRAVPNYRASFTASKLHSPFTTVRDLAAKWIAAKDDPEQKQTFINTQLGQPYKAEVTKALTHNALMSRCEVYPAELPEGVVLLTAGVDVQSGGTVSAARIEAEVVGWGLYEESWSIDTGVFYGDPAAPQVWADLDAYLLRKWQHARGIKMSVMAACVDTGGHNTQDAYRFAVPRVGRNVWPIKGASDREQWSPVWPQAEKAEKFRTGFKPIIIGVNSAKEAIRQRLLIAKPGPGYCHFPTGRAENWFEQLTAEKLLLVKRGGHTIRVWEKRAGRANEALDCRVYAYAALTGLYQVRKLNIDSHAKIVESLCQAVEKPLPAQPRARVRRSQWMGNE